MATRRGRPTAKAMTSVMSWASSASTAVLVALGDELCGR